eukprot:CAMPEP_0197445160 /NCGR_PEP_ID=MMETSP1175-20131217/10449_1 /TAXON_ID=1003142 /ORGANISM="Triceratium dubium, Strain CCMP147" /LENGTH=182 /DNA_ID=CAMNT_0042976071 /DNA_START=1 /DNA_END=546 /DNA_ORIENTATION=-
MEFDALPHEPVIQLLDMDEKIGQMPHASPTVFSFFLPEFSPQGTLEDGTLVGPEASVLDMPRIVGLLDGLFSMIKYGLAPCYNGFTDGNGGGCNEGTYERATGILEYGLSGSEVETSRELQADTVVDEMATLMTAGRLSEQSRQIIKEAYNSVSSDSAAAIRVAQQLIVSSPEFHTTNPNFF